MNKFILFIVIALIAVEASGDDLVLGVGNRLCEYYIADIKENEELRSVYLSFTHGYISSYNNFNDGKIGLGISDSQLEEMMLRYCESEPGQRFVAAPAGIMFWLAMEEAKKAIEQ